MRGRTGERRGGVGSRRPQPAGASHRHHCSWSEGSARCPVSYLDKQDLLFDLGDGLGIWCPFHKPDAALEYLGFDLEQTLATLSELIREQARRYHHISLPGFYIPCDFQISSTRVFERLFEDDWAATLSGIDLRGCEIDGDLSITDFHWQGVDLDIHDAQVLGRLEVRADATSKLGHINLDNANIGGDLSITCGDDRRAQARRMSFQNLKCLGRAEISGFAIQSSVTFSRARIAYALQLTNCSIDPTRANNMSSFDEQLGDAMRNAVELGDPRDEHNTTKFGPLMIDKCDIHGSLALDPAAAMHLQISRTRIDGLIETSGLSMPENTMIFHLELGLGLADYGKLLNRSTVPPSEHHQYDLARFKRSFRALRAVTHDLGQQAVLLRQERAVTAALSRVDSLTRGIWLAHEFFTSSGENWRYPAAVIICNVALFTSMILLFDPRMTVAQALATSTTNSIAPFLSLQSIVDRASLTTVILSVLQSAITAALLSSIFLSLKAKMQT